jgi:signal peptidase I
MSPASPAPAHASAPHPGPEGYQLTLIGTIREWIEALIIAFIVAMFVRAFVFELFRVPSGSMTPAIIGDLAVQVDIDANGEPDQVVIHPQSFQRYQVFYRIDGVYRGVDNFAPSGQLLAGVRRVAALAPADLGRLERAARPRYDHILVNKFRYWFDPVPQRGDIMVFKVPPPEFRADRPYYIKRVAGLPGETISIGGNGEILSNGERITQPPVFERTYHTPLGDWLTQQRNAMRVPADAFLAIGDNSYSSRDSRFWGPVPLENLKGKAFIRYWPMDAFGFLE